MGSTIPTYPLCLTDESPLTFAPQQLTSWAVRRSKAKVRVIVWTGSLLVWS